ncbi:hypothetical protein AKJ16_DCAP25400, partial [Drosera capensis]
MKEGMKKGDMLSANSQKAGEKESGGMGQPAKKVEIKGVISSRKLKLFAILDTKTLHPQFMDAVGESWDSHVTGCAMYRLAMKFKKVKVRLKEFNHAQFSYIYERVLVLQHEVDSFQRQLIDDPMNVELAQEERYIKARKKSKQINALTDDNGSVNQDKEALQQPIVQYFMKLFSESRDGRQMSMEEQTIMQSPEEMASSAPLSKVLGLGSGLEKDDDKEFIEADVTEKEVQQVLFSMSRGKAPGPDGYTMEFVTSTWTIIKQDVLPAVMKYFRNSRTLKEVPPRMIRWIKKAITTAHISIIWLLQATVYWASIFILPKAVIMEIDK